MMQFQIALDAIPKIKPTRHTSEFQEDSITQVRKFIINRLQHMCFLVINVQFLRTPILKIISERRLLKIYTRCCYFEFQNVFQPFYKIGVLKTSEKFLGNLITSFL